MALSALLVSTFAVSAVADEALPRFDAAYMADAANIKMGQEVWAKQCRHCHGNSAYPGKAPKLSPGGLEPDFIYDRVTNGFRGMPPWNAVFTVEERKAVVAYIKSNGFAP
jgi:mono/diheme cytochrome c family protein